MSATSIIQPIDMVKVRIQLNQGKTSNPFVGIIFIMFFYVINY